ncbi:MAG TPA: permease [Fibrobacteres bacterium]|jgi:lipoprotein-releasing system permease protein|nr:permease [Fibrobacterota bacterium]
MFKPIDFFIALRYLRGKRKIGFISVITYISAAGVCLGALVLIVALSVANGFEKEVRDRIVGTLAHAKIMQYYEKPIVNYDSLRRVILKQPEVIGASPYIMAKGGIECDKTQEAVLINGIDPATETTVTDISRKITFGKFSLDSMESERKRKLPAVIIGIGLADKLGVRPGGEVVVGSLISDDNGELSTTPRMARFVVSGIFETGMYEYDLNLVYISLGIAQNLLNIHGVEGIQIKTSDVFQADRIAKNVKDSLGGYPLRAIDWKSQNKSLFEWMRLERLIIFLVISLIILVAAFNIISSLIMMILEKRREIGILMSMGATHGSIMRIFMLNGVVIGFLGSTVGTALGLGLCYIQQRWALIPLPGDIYFINKLPVSIQWFPDVILIYVSANILCFLATLYPAWLASKVLPAESIRIE